jgi:hypothetical protein
MIEQKQTEYKTYKGFELFNDIEDDALRTRNRAVVLANIAEDHTKDRRINAKGASLILGYFHAIIPEERNTVRVAFADNMKQRGFALVA